MKTILLALLLPIAAWAQCTTLAECEANIRANQVALREIQCD